MTLWKGSLEAQEAETSRGVGGMYTESGKDMRMEDVTERQIRSYIEQLSPNDYYDDVIAGEEAFEVHYHLSSLRRGILNWYDFRPDGKLLELGGGYGELTGLLCERCAAVTVVETDEERAELLKKRYAGQSNLRVLSGDWQQLLNKERFDYVVCLEMTQCEAEPLDRLAGLLKLEGRLLISYENCFGLKYICGMPERQTGRLFEGIRGYVAGGKRCAFSRGEICAALERSKFQKYKFYYPLPDDRLPQLIYTDSRLPEENIMERLLPYYETTDTLMCKEEKLYGEVVSQGAFPFMSNSFLIECSLNSEVSDISYAALSLDRGRERSFATVIHQSGEVHKIPLYFEGRENARGIVERASELERRGIPMIPHTYCKNEITMPLINLPTLADYLRKQVPKTPEIFLEVLRKMYQMILGASDVVSDEKNALLLRMQEQFKEQPEKLGRLNEVEWGPVLKKAYIELVALNCFFDEADGSYRFFDQEYVRENYPAGYVLYRTVAISYAYIPNLEAYLPLQRVKDEFGLSRAWEFYECEEALFLDEVRCRTRYRQLLRWTFPDMRNVWKKLNRTEYQWCREGGRQLILFGTGKKFRDYMNASQDIPIFAVDNDSSKWGTRESGVEIHPPEAILEIPRGRRQVLICCRKTEAIEEQLRKMGVNEFWTYSEIME